MGLNVQAALDIRGSKFPKIPAGGVGLGQTCGGFPFLLRLLATTETASEATPASVVTTVVAGIVVTAIISCIVTTVVTGIVITTIVSGVVVVAAVVPGIVTAIVSGVVITTVVSTIVASVVTTFGDLELDTVVLRTALGNGHEHGLMVRRADHGARPVSAGGKTTGDDGGEQAVVIDGVVHALEEGELPRVRGVGASQRANILDGNVGVTNDVSVTGDLLGRRVVRHGRVGERAGLEVVRAEGDGEVGAGLDSVAGLGESDDGGNHVIAGGDLAHGRGVAGSGRVLLAIGESLARAEVDEVVVITENEKKVAR